MKRTKGNKVIGWAMVIMAFETIVLLSAGVHAEEHGFWKTLVVGNLFYAFLLVVTWMAVTGLKFISRSK